MAPWQTTDFPHGAGTVIAEFSVRADGPIWRAQVPATADGIPTAAPYLCLAVRDGHLTLTARSLSPDRPTQMRSPTSASISKTPSASILERCTRPH